MKKPIALMMMLLIMFSGLPLGTGATFGTNERTDAHLPPYYHPTSGYAPQSWSLDGLTGSMLTVRVAADGIGCAC